MRSRPEQLEMWEMKVGQNVSSCDASCQPHRTSLCSCVSLTSPLSPLAGVAWGRASELPVSKLIIQYEQLIMAI